MSYSYGAGLFITTLDLQVGHDEDTATKRAKARYLGPKAASKTPEILPWGPQGPQIPARVIVSDTSDIPQQDVGDH